MHVKVSESTTNIDGGMIKVLKNVQPDMKVAWVFLVLFLLAKVYAQVSMPPGYKEKYPKYYYLSKKMQGPLIHLNTD
ncbi:unnamed protein product [Colias eurytheme]|nr:unnamed protein product [Colias eurytheme]